MAEAKIPLALWKSSLPICQFIVDGSEQKAKAERTSPRGRVDQRGVIALEQLFVFAFAS